MKKALTALVIIGLVVAYAGQRIENSRQAAQVSSLKSEAKDLKTANNSLQHEVSSLKKQVEQDQTKITLLQMVASWYGPGFHGNATASGVRFDMNAYTCAHKTLPFGTILVVEANGHRIPCVVNDRGPFVTGRDIDLSYATANALGMVRKGVDRVKVYQVRV